ncbi:hypothetical protein D0C36_06940 [Mucilaginibacter conchicola]|uniref:Uncharacterized protein n=1 Tax=Mucilaginibacter conchicola TaxID=2303333 RepID=A0A372P0K0_9SPHI|nr:hypothetical protein [Mucilaginibacter conchicola]RFZ95257.1 hypothetical protein D0C36_06940 [Mucilaginibacter conchicola]
MKVGFDNVYDHVISVDDFVLKWRFNSPAYNELPKLHLDQLKPLDKEGSRFLWDFISETRLHNDMPFKKNFFDVIDYTRIFEGNKIEIKKWLYQREIPFKKDVFLSYQPDIALIVPWKLLIKYFDDFQYADDLTVIDESLNWALLFHHEGMIYFGSNKKFVPADLVPDEDNLF